jgi:hypothetical protein
MLSHTAPLYNSPVSTALKSNGTQVEGASMATALATMGVKTSEHRRTARNVFQGRVDVVGVGGTMLCDDRACLCRWSTCSIAGILIAA